MGRQRQALAVVCHFLVLHASALSESGQIVFWRQFFFPREIKPAIPQNLEP
jgi:hypothetical protein